MWRSSSQLLLLVAQLTTALAAGESDEFNNEDPDIVYVTDLPEVVTVTDASPIVETMFDTVYYTVTSDSVVEVTEEVTETITEEVVSTSLGLSVSTSASTHTDTLVLTEQESTTIVSWVTNTVVENGVTSLVSSATSFVSVIPDEYVTVVETVVEVDSSYPTYTFTEEATFEDVSTITHTYVSTFTTPIVEVINSTTTYLSTIGSVEEVSTITTADVVTIDTDELEAIEAVEEITLSNTASTTVYFTTISSKNDTEASTETSSETSSSTFTGNIDDIETSTTATVTDDAGLNCTSGKPCYTKEYSTMSCGSSRCTGAPGQGCPCKSDSMCTMRPGQECPCKSDSMCTMRPGHNGSGMGSCQGSSNCTAMRPSTTMDTMNFCQRPISTTYVANGLTYTTTTCDTVWETAMNHASAAAAARAPYYNATSCGSWCNMTAECSTNPAACMTNGAVSIVPVQSERAAMAAASVTAAMERTTNAVNAFHGAANTLGLSFGSIVIFALSYILL